MIIPVLRNIALSAFMLIVTLSGAQGAHAELELDGNGRMGTYCNASTYGGTWALYASEEPLEVNCQRVESWLRRNARSPIEHRLSGGYYLDQINDVWVDCREFSDSFAGIGRSPIEHAFQFAQQMGATDCLFFVNW